MHPRIAALLSLLSTFAFALACDGDPVVTASQVERPHPVVVAGSDVSADTAVDTVAETSAPEDATSDSARTDAPDTHETNNSGDTGDTAEPDTTPAPIFPFVRQGDTRTATHDLWDRYACAPETDESGAEEVFTFEIEHLGILRATVDDVSGDGVDVDVHLLPGGANATPDDCVRRDNTALAWVVRPGTWTVVVDTWVGGDGVPRAGPFRLEVDFVPLDSGRCALDDVEQRMFWGACATGAERLDCRDDGAMRYLRVPSLGPVVGEAHLVTVDEDFPGDGWPTALRDQIDRHYSVSQAATGYMMQRDEPWAPEGEGGSHWGGGATGQKLPVLDEAWYVNMYWRDRPARGRRMLVVEPWSGRAVVTAAGYETGPGSNTAIGGASEETHDHLGSHHRQDLVMGFLSDDTLPLGPITCW